MNKKLTVFIGFVLLVAVLGYLNTKPSEVISTVTIIPQENPVNLTQHDPCSNITGVSERNACYFKISQTNPDITICDKITDYNLKTSCTQMAAVSSRVPELCIGITPDYYRDFCYRDVAIAIPNPTICGAIIFQETRMQCYDKINLTGLDKFQVCSNIQDKDNRNECYDLLQKRS